MGRPKSGTHAIPTLERIMLAAEEDFGRSGYKAARLGDIAKTASIRRPSLLYHFGTKEKLYDAVVQRIFRDLQTELLEAMQTEGDFNSRVIALMDAYLSFLERRPNAGLLVLREMIDGIGPGRKILERQLIPVLDGVEAYLSMKGESTIPEGIDVRQALMAIVSVSLIRLSAGPLAVPLWGENSDQLALARHLLVKQL